MFEKFADYMQYLLTTPLKGGGNSNQFYLFFKVIGSLFDDTKEDIMRLREETLIETASTIMLEIHGQERDMIRLKGESVEGFRKRLQMKAIISELSGSEAGILLWWMRYRIRLLAVCKGILLVSGERMGRGLI